MDDPGSIAKRLTASYPDFDVWTPCSFVLASNDFEYVDDHLGAPCHASLSLLYSRTYDQIFTSYPVKDEERDLAFFEFMKTRLYRNWSDFIHLKSHEDKYYIHLTDLDKIPAKVVYNFCICSRLIQEYPKRVNDWYKMQKSGLDPAFAFAVGVLISVPGNDNWADTVIKETKTAAGHLSIDNQLSLKNIVFCDPDYKGCTSYKEFPNSCIPTNTIWGSSKDLQGLIGKTIREFWTNWKLENNYEDLLQPSR